MTNTATDNKTTLKAVSPNEKKGTKQEKRWEKRSLCDVFGFGPKVEVPVLLNKTPFTPDKDPEYILRKEIAHDIFAWWLVGQGEGLFLTGPSGSGKSSIIRHICAEMNIPLQHMVGHARLEFQEMVVTPHIRNGNTHYTLGPLASAMRHGYVFLLDEIDLIDPATNAALNEIIQGKPLILPEFGTPITPHSNFRFIATGNTRGTTDTTGRYQGTVGQNLAFMDRFWTVEVGYAPADVELSILSKKVPGMKEEVLSRMIEVANTVRKSFMGEYDSNNDMGGGQQCEVTLSTRTLCRWARAAQVLKRVAIAKNESPLLYALDRALCNRADPSSAHFIRGIAQRILGA